MAMHNAKDPRGVAWRVPFEPRAWVAVAMLAGAAVSDLRTRRVPNRYWLPFIAAAALFVADDITTGERARMIELAMAGILCTIFYGLFRLRAYGGADAKALMVLAFLVPAAPTGVPVVLGALLVGSLCIVLFPVVLTLANALQGNVQFPAMFLGIPMSLDAARDRKVWPMQDVEDGQLVWRYWRMVGVDAAARIDRLQSAGVERTWVTPKIPYLLFVGAGLAATLLWDPLALLLAGVRSGS